MIALLLSLLAGFGGHSLHTESSRALPAEIKRTAPAHVQSMRAFGADKTRTAPIHVKSLRAFAA